MNETWKGIFEKYINSYNAINILRNNNIIEKDEYFKLRSTLLADIIICFESEIKK